MNILKVNQKKENKSEKNRGRMEQMKRKLNERFYMKMFTESPLVVRKMDTFSFHICTHIHNSQNKCTYRLYIFFL